MSSDIKWIKIVTDLFDDEKIQLIETLPESDTILTIWFKMLCLAGKCNNSGLLTLAGGKIPYSDSMLAAIFRRKLSSVQLAIETFKNFGMVEVFNNNVIGITNWEKHQKLDAYEKIKERTRKRVQDHREKQKAQALLTQNVKSEPNLQVCNVTETLQSRYSNANVTQVESDIDKDIRKEMNTNVFKKKSSDEPSFSLDGEPKQPSLIPSLPSDNDTSTSRPRNVNESSTSEKRGQVQVFYNKWSVEYNRLCPSLPKCLKINDKRRTAIKLNLEEKYSDEEITTVLKKSEASDFMTGKKNGWVANFEWVMTPGNFQKILEGSYDNRTSSQLPKNSWQARGEIAAHTPDFPATDEDKQYFTEASK